MAVFMSHHPIEPDVKPARGARLHLMLTCLCDAFYPEVGIAAVECLEAAGYRVAFDERQTCCGQPAFNTGDRAAALRVARHTLDVFRSAETVIVPSGSCAAMIRWGYSQLFEGQRDFEAAMGLARRTYEFMEFLVKVAGMVPWPGAYGRPVGFHRSCHSRELSLGDGPERLLGSIRGIDLRPIPQPEQCCGFGGTFSVTFPWVSREMGHAKLDAFRQCGAGEIVSGDMGCLMHLRGLAARGAPGSDSVPRMRHVAELLRDSLREGKSR